MNKKNAIYNVTSFILGGMLVADSMFAVAESTVVTSQGTFKCDNTCVVDDAGGVTYCCGGSV